jgi:hypothetical protein
MPEPDTTRLGIPQYEDTEPASFSTQVNAISKAVDAKAAVYAQGVAADRPAAGIAGRYYFATDTEVQWLDTGTEWVLASPLRIVEHAASVVASSGERVKATTAITVTTPAAVKDATFGVLANGHAVTVKAASGDIFGDFIEGAAEIKLVGYQHVTLQSDGTNWYIVAGEPKRESSWTGSKSYSKAEVEAGVEPSPTRAAFVVFDAAVSTFSIGGGPLLGNGSALADVPYLVPAGQKWKGASAAEAQYLLL